MEEVLAPTRSGPPTVIVDGHAVHSKYDPCSEAERYAAAIPRRGDDEVLLLVEPALGYLLPPLRRRFPRSRVIALHCSDFYAGRDAAYDDSWHPAHPLDLTSFLEARIPQGARCRIIEWRPALEPYGRAFADLMITAADFVKREEASRRTAEAFGRRWVSNALRNLRWAAQAATVQAGTAPVVVAAAGPSLERALPAIRSGRKGCFVVAVSSSLEILAAGGIRPDLVLASDGGSWAKLHLRRPAGPTGSCAGVYSLTAAVPGPLLEDPAVLLADGSVWQSVLLGGAGIPFMQLPQRGTVAATGIDFSLRASSGPVFLAGFDMAGEDIRTHGRPHAFDPLIDAESGRLRPLYDLKYRRARAMAEGGSLDVYARWFKSHLSLYGGRVAVLGSAHGAFDGLPRIERIDGPAGAMPRLSIAPVPAGAAERGAAALAEALKDGSGKLSGELAELLPGSAREALESIIRKNLGRGHGARYLF